MSIAVDKNAHHKSYRSLLRGKWGFPGLLLLVGIVVFLLLRQPRQTVVPIPVRTDYVVERYQVLALRLGDQVYTYHGGGMNDRTAIVGAARLTASNNVAFLYTGRTLVPLPSRNERSFALAVNNSGTVVGGLDKGDGVSAALWKGAALSVLGSLPGDRQSVATAINDLGEIVGRSYDQSGDWPRRPTKAFAWQSGKVRDLGHPAGCTSASAFGINNAGDVVGWTLTSERHTRAFFCKQGKMILLSALPGGDECRASSLNDKDVIVGNSETDAGFQWPWNAKPPFTRAVAWIGSGCYDLGAPKTSAYSTASAISPDNVIVGYYTTAGLGDRRSFVWDSTHGLRDLTNLEEGDDWIIEEAFSINKSGQILVYAKPRHRAGEKTLAVLMPEGSQH